MGKERKCQQAVKSRLAKYQGKEHHAGRPRRRRRIKKPLNTRRTGNPDTDRTGPS